MQIASPNYTPGGAAGAIHPETVGHITNEHDLVMRLVRNTLGAVDPNFSGDANPRDPAGHSLVQSYLAQPGQSTEIISQLRRISRKLTPYPMHGQAAASSSAPMGSVTRP